MIKGKIRKVDKFSPYTKKEPEGVTMVLECRHVIWHAGLKSIPDEHECLMGGCLNG